MFLIMSKPSLFRVFVLLGGAAVVNSKTGYTCRETFDQNLAIIREKTNSDIHFSIPSDAVLYSRTNRRHRYAGASSKTSQKVLVSEAVRQGWPSCTADISNI